MAPPPPTCVHVRVTGRGEVSRRGFLRRLAAGGAAAGLDWCLGRWWPSLGPAEGLVFAVTAPSGVALFAILLARVVRLADRVPLPDGLGRPLASG